MSASNGSVELASFPDRENLVAEAWSEGVQLCEVSYEQGQLLCIVFADEGTLPSHADLVAKAEWRLRELYGIPPSTPMKVAMHRDSEVPQIVREQTFGA